MMGLFLLRLHILLTQNRRNIIHARDHDRDRKHLSTGGTVVEQIDILLEKETNAASAHKPDDRGHAHVDIPTIHRVRNIRWDDLRNDRIDNRL